MNASIARRGRTTVIALAALAASGLAACGSNGNGAAAEGASKLAVKLTDHGCAPARASAPAGPLTITVANAGTSAVTEMELKNTDGVILGERENVVAGLSGSFTLNLQPGRYVMSCPNGDSEDN